MQHRAITVVGAGITGLWQALTLARRGHGVRLVEQSAEPFTQAASAYAGAMLGPFCETEAEALAVRDLGLTAIGLWRRVYPATAVNGTLVLAHARDAAEIERFARLTEGHMRLDAAAIGDLEPHLKGRFSSGLFYAEEGHVAPPAALRFLLDEAERAGVEIMLGTPWQPALARGLVIDCRGMGAQVELPELRGVRGERIILRSREIDFQRPVRLLHPRHPLYVVPWGHGRFMLGASVIESEEQGPVSVRSALELLSMAYALHPGFAEAEIIEMGAGVRPALPDNIPKIVVRGDIIYVNGTYRHGFLLAPALAELVADYLERGAIDNRVFVTG
jgi:glycine oxidase